MFRYLNLQNSANAVFHKKYGRCTCNTNVTLLKYLFSVHVSHTKTAALNACREWDKHNLPSFT